MIMIIKIKKADVTIAVTVTAIEEA